MSLDGWSIKKYVTNKLDEFDGYILQLAKKVLVLEAQLSVLKEEICQVRKNAQPSQKKVKPTEIASATKGSSAKLKKATKAKT